MVHHIRRWRDDRYGTLQVINETLQRANVWLSNGAGNYFCKHQRRRVNPMLTITRLM